MSVLIKIKSLDPKAKIPEYKTAGASGFDISIIEDYTIAPRETAVLRTGLAFEIPQGYELQIRTRSGTAIMGLSIANSPGTLDSDYRGELKLILRNNSNVPYDLVSGMRLAQGVITTVSRAMFKKVNELSKTERDQGGFGSTGL